MTISQDVDIPARTDLIMSICVPRRPDIVGNGWMREVPSMWALQRLHAAGQRLIERGVREQRTGRLKCVVRYEIGDRGNGIWIFYGGERDAKWGPDYRTVFIGGGRAWHRAERWAIENEGKGGNPWLVEYRG